MEGDPPFFCTTKPQLQQQHQQRGVHPTLLYHPPCCGSPWEVDNTLPTSYSHALGKHAVALLGRFNKGALIAKLDLQAAFPMVPVLASKWELLGMHWHDNYYVDTCLPFGRLAPSILTTFPVPSTSCWNTWLPSCTTWPGPLFPV